MADSLTITGGGAVFTGQRIVISSSPSTQGFPTDGVIGATLLAPRVMEIDYDRRRILLHDPDGFDLGPGWEEIPITVRRTIPFLSALVAVSGGDPVPATLYVDSAAGEPLVMLVGPDMKFELPEEMEDRYLGTGLSGDVHGGVGRVSRVEIGPFVLEDVAAAFAPAEVRSKQPGADGIIGGGLLRRFDVVFDYPRERLLIRPSREFGTSFGLE
jgi:hypothetical protein